MLLVPANSAEQGANHHQKPGDRLVGSEAAPVVAAADIMIGVD
jgi:hypothetical protein